MEINNYTFYEQINDTFLSVQYASVIKITFI